MCKSKFIVMLLVVFVLMCISFYVLSYSENFKVFTSALGEFGSRASSDNFSKRIGSGGQGSVIGISQGTEFYGMQGYVHYAAFEHGDANASGDVTIADIVYLVNYILKGGPEPIPLETGDVNCDHKIEMADIVYIQNYLYNGGPAPCNL